MSQFTVYKNNNAETRTLYPLLLDVQSPLLDTLETRMVVPLTPASGLKNKTLTTLTPTFEIESKSWVMLTPQMAGIPRKTLGTSVAMLADKRQEILAAIDFLITGI
jgi:toxin CcdB